MNALCLPPGLRFARAQAADAVARFEDALGEATVEGLAASGHDAIAVSGEPGAYRARGRLRAESGSGWSQTPALCPPCRLLAS
jgi:hypothetical protein